MVAKCCKTIRSCDPVFTMAPLFNLGQLREAVWLDKDTTDTTDSQMSPQPRLCLGCGDIWESVVPPPWPETRYQFLQYNENSGISTPWRQNRNRMAELGDIRCTWYIFDIFIVCLASRDNWYIVFEIWWFFVPTVYATYIVFVDD